LILDTQIKDKKKVDVSMLNSGIYIYSIESNLSQKTGKLVVE